MKQNKGITLISLIITIIAMTIVVSTLAIITNSFYRNINYVEENSKYIGEYNKFNAYFIEDIKKNMDVQEITDNKIVLDDGTVYTYVGESDNSLYRNKVKICSNIVSCKFTKSTITVSSVQKNIITVEMTLKDSKNFETKNDYVMKYW